MNRRNTSLLVTNLGLFIVVFMALVLRAMHLGNGLAGDEGFTCGIILEGFSGIIRQTLLLSEPHPVGYYFLLRAWILLAGNSELATRWVSVWFGVLAVALLARFCFQLFPGRYGRWVALAAAGLMAVNSFTVSQSREMRMYAMLLALSLASTLLMLMVLQRPRRRTWVAYVLITWLVLQTHYYALFIVVAQNAYVGILWLTRQLKGPRKLFLHWIIAEAIVAAFTLPWLYIARNILLTYHGFGTMPSLSEAVVFVLSVFGVGPHLTEQRTVFALLSGALLVLAWLKLLRGDVQHKKAALLLALYFVVPVMITWWLSQSRPVWKDRYLIAAVNPYLVLIGVAIVPSPVQLRDRFARVWARVQPVLGPAMAVALCAGIVIGLRAYINQEWVHGTNVYRGMHDAFVTYSSGFSTKEYRWAVTYPDYAFTCYLDTPDYMVIPSLPNDKAAAEKAVQEAADNGVRRLLLMIVNDGYWNGPDVAVSALSKDFTQIAERYTGYWPLKIYSSVGIADLHAQNASFANGLLLASSAIYPDIQGHLVEVDLLWNGNTQAISAGLKQFIHVMKQDGAQQLVAQDDTQFVADDVAGSVRRYGVTLPDTLSTGKYEVTVGLYNANHPDMPRVNLASGTDSVVIGQFSIP
jgi:hypothetical protein